MDKFQKFFINNPVIGGICIFIFIALIVSIIYLIIFFVSPDRRTRTWGHTHEGYYVSKSKSGSSSSKSNNNIEYVLGCDEINGNLWLEDDENNIISKSPSRSELLEIISSENQKLYLPESGAQFLIETDELGMKRIVVSSKMNDDRDLFLYKSLVEYLRDLNTPWAISKFR